MRAIMNFTLPAHSPRPLLRAMRAMAARVLGNTRAQSSRRNPAGGTLTSARSSVDTARNFFLRYPPSNTAIFLMGLNLTV